jgi:hypothetical protein
VGGQGLCNAHHLRELVAVTDLDGQRWSERMTNLLLEMLEARNTAMEAGRTELEPERVAAFEQAYDRVIRRGRRENPRRAGKRPPSKAANCCGGWTSIEPRCFVSSTTSRSRSRITRSKAISG